MQHSTPRAIRAVNRAIMHPTAAREVLEWGHLGPGYCTIRAICMASAPQQTSCIQGCAAGMPKTVWHEVQYSIWYRRGIQASIKAYQHCLRHTTTRGYSPFSEGRIHSLTSLPDVYCQMTWTKVFGRRASFVFRTGTLMNMGPKKFAWRHQKNVCKFPFFIHGMPRGRGEELLAGVFHGSAEITCRTIRLKMGTKKYGGTRWSE